MLYGMYIFLTNTEKTDIFITFLNGKADNIALSFVVKADEMRYNTIGKLDMEDGTMISRKIEKELQRFRDSAEKKALLITGARQVGKTFIIREFGKQYESFVEINFYENRPAQALFENAKDSQDLLLEPNLSRTFFIGNSFLQPACRTGNCPQPCPVVCFKNWA